MEENIKVLETPEGVKIETLTVPEDGEAEVSTEEFTVPWDGEDEEDETPNSLDAFLAKQEALDEKEEEVLQ